MTREELRIYQTEHAVNDLYHLASLCRDRFLRAADLVGIGGDAIQHLRRFGHSERVDLEPLMHAWRAICQRYATERYSPQLSLFPDAETGPVQLWRRFVRCELFPTLVRDDEVVRNVLRALGGLPCTTAPEAAAALEHYFRGMVLPGCNPPWVSQEELDR